MAEPMPYSACDLDTFQAPVTPHQHRCRLDDVSSEGKCSSYRVVLRLVSEIVSEASYYDRT